MTLRKTNLKSVCRFYVGPFVSEHQHIQVKRPYPPIKYKPCYKNRVGLIKSEYNYGIKSKSFYMVYTSTSMFYIGTYLLVRLISFLDIIFGVLIC